MNLSIINNPSHSIQMKIFPNLPGNLRILFGFSRGLTALLAAFWLFQLTMGAWFQTRFMADQNLMVTLGEVSLQAAPGALALTTRTAKPGEVVLHGLRGQLNLNLNLLSGEANLVSAARWSLLPAMAAGLAFSWLVFGALRQVCANIERGEVFSDKNLRLVRSIGVLLIAYGFVGGATGFWASHVMGGYLSEHVALTGLGEAIRFPTNGAAFNFTLPSSFSYAGGGGLVTGCLVLVVSEAFRQGLVLKTESDLTV